ncbi:hypothetical protein SDC9_121309 [bioreactor metagenome]|uniref:Uncharacterized protein n=1 Tax=bioreactor metagenome TaxID=1076179 RepID=A0A645CBQ9_9ZZZZ
MRRTRAAAHSTFSTPNKKEKELTRRFPRGFLMRKAIRQHVKALGIVRRVSDFLVVNEGVQNWKNKI